MLRTKNGKIQTAEVASGGSYLSQSSATPLSFGLGKEDEVEFIRIRWPGGKFSTVTPNPWQYSIAVLQPKL